MMIWYCIVTEAHRNIADADISRSGKENMVMAKLIGVKAIVTKSGNKGYEYHFADDFSLYDHEHAECYGNQVFSEYSSHAFKVSVGDEVDIIYGKGFQGKAQLVDILSASDSKLKTNK